MPTSSATAKHPAKGLKDIVEAGNISALTGFKLGLQDLVPAPDALIVFRNTSGPSGELAQAIDYPGVQVLVRAGPAEYEKAWAAARAVSDHLVRIPTGGAQYPELTSCAPRGGIIDLGKDDKNRPLFSLNFQLIVSYDSSGNRVD